MQGRETEKDKWEKKQKGGAYIYEKDPTTASLIQRIMIQKGLGLKQ